MKRLSIITLLLAFALTGCAGIQVNWGNTSEKAAKVVGCLVADNNPDWTERIVKYCDLLIRESQPIDFQYALDEGVDWLLKQYIDKPTIRLMIVDLLPEIQLTGSLPTLPWMEQVKPLILNFREGVKLCGQSEVISGLMQFDYPLDVIPSGEIADDKSFIEGVKIGAPVVSSKPKGGAIERYCDIYEANYLKFLWGRTLD